MTFILDQNAQYYGSLLGYIKLSPAKLVEWFGRSTQQTDDYKVSGEYIFSNKDGVVFTLYDWKSTDLYDSCCLTPDEFWSSTQLYEFHIGGTNKALINDFKDFITSYDQFLHKTANTILLK